METTFAFALEYAMEKLLKQLQSNIMKIVYGAGSPSSYDVTWQFLDSWEKSRVRIMGNVLESEIFQNIGVMVSEPGIFQHGSEYFQPNDARDFIADIIFEGKAGPLFGEGYWTQARDAWTPTVEHLYNGDFLRWFDEGVAIAGGLGGASFNIEFVVG